MPQAPAEHLRKSPSPRLLVDVTTSLYLAGQPPIGITRVEGEIARRLLQARDLRAIPVVFRDGVLFAIGPQEVARIFGARPDAQTVERARLRVPKHAADPGETRADALGRGAPDRQDRDVAAPVALRLRATGLMRRATRAGVERLPDSIREDVRAILIHGRQIVRSAVYRAPPSYPAPPSPAQAAYVPALRDDILPKLRVIVHPAANDVLWTAGLYSHFVPLRRVAELSRRTGLRCVAMCYDLIRVTMPRFNPPDLSGETFAADTVALLDAAEHLIAISDWTRRELLAFAERVGRPPPAVEVVQLGFDFAPTGTMDGAATMPPELDGARRFALAVGTVEPRKNFGMLVRLWERIVARRPDFPLDLVIVGREGHGVPESAAEIEKSPLFGTRIFWLDRCPDAALRRLYERCDLALCPSLAEGWGLPVAEALSFGRPVISSDRGALPEAGRGAALHIDPDDEAAWERALIAAADSGWRTVEPPNLPSWDAAAAEVESRLRALLADGTQRKAA